MGHELAGFQPHVLASRKTICTSAMRNLVPPHISWVNKQPFDLPIDDWLRSEWRILAQEVLLDRRTQQRGWFDHKLVRTNAVEQLKGTGFHGRQLYQILPLELWARAILDKGQAASRSRRGIDDCARELSPERPVRRIAVLAPAGIGDTMRLTPALRQLGRSDPIWVTRYTAAGRGSDEVMAGVTPVDRHVPIPFLGKSKDKFNHLVWDLRHNCPDQLVSTWSSRLAGLASFFSGAKQRCGWVPQWALTMKLNKLFLDSSVNLEPLRKNVGLYDTLTFAELLGLGELTMEAPSFSAPIWEENALIRARKVRGFSPPDSDRKRRGAGEYSAAAISLASDGPGSAGLLKRSRANCSAGRRQPFQIRHVALKRVIGSRGLDLSGRVSLTATVAMIQECDVALSIHGPAACRSGFSRPSQWWPCMDPLRFIRGPQGDTGTLC